MSSSANCVIIGASHAGVNCAFSLRQAGWNGPIVLIDAQAQLPYHRPPLSKSYLLGNKKTDDKPLKAAESYAETNIDLRLGECVASIDRARKHIVLKSKEELPYDKLVIATGAEPILPPIPGLQGNAKVIPLRTAAHAHQILQELDRSGLPQVGIIGGGYIGLEVAAAIRQKEAKVTLFERENNLLGRVTSPYIADYFLQLHRSRGVNILLNHTVASITENGDKQIVECSDGSTYSFDLIVLGVGVYPAVGLAAQAGLNTSDGLEVNKYCQTSDPNIYGIGDCALCDHQRYGKKLRIESVQNAVDQAKVVACHLTGRDLAYDSIPWFWSDQYEVKLQMVGLQYGYNETLVRHEPQTEGPDKISVWYFEDEKLLAVDAINDGKAYVVGSRLLQAEHIVDKALLADISVPLHPKKLAITPSRTTL
ncbi:MAG: FAD-dependent oxidoreductase [Bacteroidota bacterium]